jgi:hypothetical protein
MLAEKPDLREFAGAIGPTLDQLFSPAAKISTRS